MYLAALGKTWQMSETALPHNGEAQLAEVRKSDGSSAILFNGRTSKTGSPRGISWSYDDGQTFTNIKFVDDISAGVSCMASLLSLDEHPVLTPPSPIGARAVAKKSFKNSTSLLFSHPSHANRSAGVLLQSNDAAVSEPSLHVLSCLLCMCTPGQKLHFKKNLYVQETWVEVQSSTPEQPDAMYAYSNLNMLPAEDSDKLSIGLTYETGDTGCAASAAACKIVYRTFEL